MAAKKIKQRELTLEEIYSNDIIKELWKDYENHTPGDVEDGLAERSVYAVWWKCLKLSPDYPPKGEAAAAGRQADLFRDFGDLGDNFRDWWRNGGRDLFVERRMIPLVSVDSVAPWDQDGPTSITVTIPMTISRWAIDQQLDLVLKKYHPGHRLERQFYSTARRKLASKRSYDAELLRRLLLVWELRQQQPPVAWWQIGEQVNTKSKLRITAKDDEGTIAEKREKITNDTRRMYKQAQKLIENAVRGDFPSFPERSNVKTTSS
jgi:hypothetical protein